MLRWWDCTSCINRVLVSSCQLIVKAEYFCRTQMQRSETEISLKVSWAEKRWRICKQVEGKNTSDDYSKKKLSWQSLETRGEKHWGYKERRCNYWTWSGTGGVTSDQAHEHRYTHTHTHTEKHVRRKGGGETQPKQIQHKKPWLSWQNHNTYNTRCQRHGWAVQTDRCSLYRGQWQIAKV